MPNALVTNEPPERASYLKALRKVAQRASFLDIAVSYVKMGGWKHLAKLIQTSKDTGRTGPFTRHRPIPDHAAARAARRDQAGITLRKYVGNRVF